MSRPAFSGSRPSAQFRQRAVVAAVVLILLVAAGWLALVVVSRIDELFFPGQSLPVGSLSRLPLVQNDTGQQGQINVLVMGLDRRPSEGNIPTRSDTMFVLSVDRQTKNAGILGIPRDLWVEIPNKNGSGYFENRINTAYETGETEGYSGGGASLVKAVIEHNLGISIDHYVVIDFQGFIKIIDDLGGIDAYVEQQVDDPYYSETERPGDYHPLHFTVGQHHMDGQTALDYSRTRFGSSDLDRIHRQQQVIFAVIDKALQQRLVSVDQLVNLWRRYKNAVVTDVNDIQAPGFAALAAQIVPAHIVALSLGAATIPWTTPDGAQVLLVDKTIVQELVQAFLSGQQATTETALVEVQNGAGVEGLAARAVSFLTSFGLSASSLSATSSVGGTPFAQTQIIDFSGKTATVQRLAGLLDVPAAQIRTARPDDRALATVAGADVLIILGKDLKDRNFAVATAGRG